MQLYLYLLLIPTRLDEYNTYLMRGTKVQVTEFILLIICSSLLNLHSSDVCTCISNVSSVDKIVN